MRTFTPADLEPGYEMFTANWLRRRYGRDGTWTPGELMDALSPSLGPGRYVSKRLREKAHHTSLNRRCECVGKPTRLVRRQWRQADAQEDGYVHGMADSGLVRLVLLKGSLPRSVLVRYITRALKRAMREERWLGAPVDPGLPEVLEALRRSEIAPLSMEERRRVFVIAAGWRARKLAEYAAAPDDDKPITRSAYVVANAFMQVAFALLDVKSLVTAALCCTLGPHRGNCDREEASKARWQVLLLRRLIAEYDQEQDRHARA